jgi:hypothetical protein
MNGKMKISSFVPTPDQAWLFSRKLGRRTFVGGGVRAGKTTCVAELISATVKNEWVVIGNDVARRIRPEGIEKPIKILLVARDSMHIADVFYSTLFRPQVTHEGARTALFKASECKRWVWEDKRRRVFSSVCITDKDGNALASVRALTSRSIPGGLSADIVWCDETQDAGVGLYSELESRTIDSEKLGLLVASCHGDETSDAFAAFANDRCSEVFLETQDNTHIPCDAIARLMGGFDDQSTLDYWTRGRKQAKELA